MSALNELLSRWRQNPDAKSTIALCSYLGSAMHQQLVQEVGPSAERQHGRDLEVMLAVGRMYLDADLYQKAQNALVAAGKLRPRDPRAFRYLGEALLRRGDAVRAEKVFARALQLGLTDDDAKLWHDRAKVYRTLQGRIGTEAVAGEVNRSLPKRSSIPASSADRVSFDLTEMEDVGDAPTLMRTGSNALGFIPRPAPVPPPSSVPPPRSSRGSHAANARVGLPPPKLPPPSAPPLAAPTLASAAAPVIGMAAIGREGSADRIELSSSDLLSDELPEDYQDLRLPAASPERAAGPFEAKVVLEHLARVGVFEADGGAQPAWEQARVTRSRGSWVLLVATVLVLGAGLGAYKYADKVRTERLAHAVQLNQQVDQMLHSGRAAKIRATDELLSESFELDSRSHEAAKLWLHNRILYALLLPNEARGIDSATHRAKTVGLKEQEYVAGKLTSFLAEGDLAGAAALLPKWDKFSAKDPYYQLAAGAVLEGAGDLRSLERYEAATRLDPKLVFAQILLARNLLLEAGAEKAKPIVSAVEKALGDHPTTRALKGLMWAVSKDRPTQIPDAAHISASERAQLVVPLRPVPYVTDAIEATDRGEFKKASKALEPAIGLSRSPAMASRIGFLAIQAGDERLARKAALRALQFAAVYPGARMLAARVALLGGRLDEAEKAIEELNPNLAEVAVVRAAVAYETLDVSGLRAAVDALGEAREQAAMAALASAPEILVDGTYPPKEALGQMAQPANPWGELIAVDAALDTGELVLADQMISAWAARGERPVYQLREARLRRYEKDAEQAAKLSRAALEEATATAPALIEHVYALVQLNNPKLARATLDKYKRLLGPMSVWLGVLVDVAAGREAQANATAAKEDLPSEAAPILLRVMVARALVAAGDKRARAYAVHLGRRFPKHPDVKQLLEDLRGR